MAQPLFSRALLKAAHEVGLHTVIETSGNGRRTDFLAVTLLVDQWLWDVKLMDEELYREYVGGSLSRMKDNLVAVAASGAAIRFRVLFIPELHDNPAIIE